MKKFVVKIQKEVDASVVSSAQTSSSLNKIFLYMTKFMWLAVRAEEAHAVRRLEA